MRNLYLRVLELGGLRSKCWQIQCLVRTTSVSINDHLLVLCPHRVERRGDLFGASFIKAVIPFMKELPPNPTSKYHHTGAESKSSSVMSNSLRPHGLYSPWNSPGQNTGVGSLSLLQGIFPSPGIKPRSPTWQADSLPAELPGKPFWGSYLEK